MKRTNEKQPNMLGEFLRCYPEEKSSGLAFSCAAFLPYILAFLFAVLGTIFGWFYDGCETDDWYLYVGYLLSQVSFALVAVGFFLVSKTSVKTLVGNPKPLDFALAIALQFGLLSLASVNSVFVLILEGLGLHAPIPQIPSLDGFGFVAVLFVIAVLPAIFEEVVFRGILLRGLKGVPVWAAALICGGIFSLFHRNPSQTVYQFLCGASFALIVLRCGSILPTVIAHFLNNAFIICAEKFAWQTDMLPILILSAVCLLGTLAYLIVGLDKKKKQPVDKSGRSFFFLCSSVGLVLCALEWISKLFGA